MTSEQKQRITEMRRLGIGYAAIADALGIPSSTVKTFCWRNQLTIKARLQHPLINRTLV